MNMGFTKAEDGDIFLVQRKEDGRLVQIGISKKQHSALQLFLAALSKDDPFLQAGKEYDLELKNK